MVKNKKATINPKNNDGRCSQYAVTVALIYQNIKFSILLNSMEFSIQHIGKR